MTAKEKAVIIFEDLRMSTLIEYDIEMTDEIIKTIESSLIEIEKE